MFQLIDQALVQFLRETVPLPAADVDVSFAAPAKDWSARLSRPTINLFLWDVRRAGTRNRAGLDHVEVDGQAFRRVPPRVVDMRYLVTVWASEHRDEHQLLGNVTRAIVAHPHIPSEHLPEGLELPDERPLGLSLSSTADRKPDDFWSSIDGQLKPGLDVLVTFALASRLIPLEEAPSEISLGVADRETGGARSTRSYVDRDT